jgi:hypothetical protein
LHAECGGACRDEADRRAGDGWLVRLVLAGAAGIGRSGGVRSSGRTRCGGQTLFCGTGRGGASRRGRMAGGRETGCQVMGWLPASGARVVCGPLGVGVAAGGFRFAGRAWRCGPAGAGIHLAARCLAEKHGTGAMIVLVDPLDDYFRLECPPRRWDCCFALSRAGMRRSLATARSRCRTRRRGGPRRACWCRGAMIGMARQVSTRRPGWARRACRGGSGRAAAWRWQVPRRQRWATRRSECAACGVGSGRAVLLVPRVAGSCGGHERRLQ